MLQAPVTCQGRMKAAQTFRCLTLISVTASPLIDSAVRQLLIAVICSTVWKENAMLSVGRTVTVTSCLIVVRLNESEALRSL